MAPFIAATALKLGLDAFAQGYHPRCAEPLLLAVAFLTLASVVARASELRSPQTSSAAA
jgi:hypothetical protein